VPRLTGAATVDVMASGLMVSQLGLDRWRLPLCPRSPFDGLPCQHTTTVNANQAVVADSVVTGNKNETTPSPKFLAAVTDKPMEIMEAENQKEAVPIGGRDTKAK
jgi:hypothetical protein